MPSTILVIDDNLVNLRLAAATLRYEGYQVLTALNAKSAFDLVCSTASIDLILMDLSLPDVDGLSFTRQLKADPRCAHIPIVILTASTMQEDEHTALNAGADGYITKPISVSSFPELIARHLNRSG